MSTVLAKNVENLIDKLGFSKEEKEFFIIMAMEYVGREMSELVERILTDDDLEKMEKMQTDEEREKYIAQRVKEDTGKEAQAISDEMMVRYLQNVEEQGYIALDKKE